MPEVNNNCRTQGDFSVAVHERLELADVRQSAGRFAGRDSHGPESWSDDLFRRLRHSLQVHILIPRWHSYCLLLLIHDEAGSTSARQASSMNVCSISHVWYCKHSSITHQASL